MSQGIYGGFMDFLTGGSHSNSQQQGANGFSYLPQQLQQAYTQYSDQLNNLYANPQQTAAAFTPMGLTSGESSALDRLNTGFTPTSQSLGSDISMLTNPFDDSVIAGINQQAAGDNSLVNQYATQAGQQGSNRSFLGTSDVEQNRLNSIGQFKQGQYNTALNQVLNNIVPQRQMDANNALQGGTYQRTLNSQINQAPYTAMNSYAQQLGVIPTTGGGSNTGSSTSNQTGGLSSFF